MRRRPTPAGAPTSSCSTPATSARRRPRRSIPSSAGCGRSRRAQPGAAHRRRRLRRPGRGGGDPRPRAGRRPGGRAAGLPPAAGHAARGARRASGRSRPTSRAEDKFDHLPADRRRAARAGGLPDRAGGLRQVLRLLRRALYPRRRGVAPGGAGRGRGARPGGARRGRDHAARPERQRLPRRRRGRRSPALVRRLARDRGARADPLHHLASERHGRRPDRGACARSRS